jgi:D-galacturonate reductase
MSAEAARKVEVVIVGGGMITHDQILPSIYHLQRQGRIGSLRINALNSAPLKALAEAKAFEEAFPGQTFQPFPSLGEPPERTFPELFKEVIASLPPHNVVVAAVPDHFHGPVIRAALEHDQHVLSVKPLVPTYAESVQIERLARKRGLLVGVEYHKRFDRRSLDARRQYRAGRFGEFRLGEAKMIEPYCYRHSNFQNWFTKENSDPFTYVGCHYVDLVYFITGLRPVEVSVRGVEGTFPNGNVGYLWAAGRVVWENGAVMSISDGLGYPDQGAGTNDQCLAMYCEGDDCGAVLKHDDQYRGVRHGYVDHAAGAMFRFTSPDYFRMVPWEGEGLKPVGYGYDSIEAITLAAIRVNQASCGLAGEEALRARRRLLGEIDARGILATPANSFVNELVTEAARLSIARDGWPAIIQYEPAPTVRLRDQSRS